MFLNKERMQLRLKEFVKQKEQALKDNDKRTYWACEGIIIEYENLLNLM